METKNKIEQMTDQDWADAAAWFSGEKGANDTSAKILMEEEAYLSKDWNEMKKTDPDIRIDVDKAWARLNTRIEAETTHVRVVRMSFMPAFLRIAAMVIVVLGIGWALIKITGPQMITIASNSDQKNIEVVLPDGSKVFLNRNSNLTYPESFSSKDRKVELTGEAFFDISPDASKPFIIDAGRAKVKVLGTSFNVMTDNGNNEVEVLVSTGKVVLSNNDGSRSITLEPGYVGRISENTGSRIINTNQNYLSWNTGALTYDGEKLRSVFIDLKRSYNIDISTSDPEIYDYQLTSVFDNQPHDTIIQVICTTFNLSSAREGETYILSCRQ